MVTKRSKDAPREEQALLTVARSEARERENQYANREGKANLEPAGQQRS